VSAALLALLKKSAMLLPAWGWVAIVGALLVGVQQLRLMSSQDDAATLTDERNSALERVGQAQAARDNLMVLVEDQNKALADLTKQAQERQAQAQVAQQQANKAAQIDYAAANRLQQERTGGDPATAASTIIDRELGL
jgi:hypothetical protein